MKKLILLLLLFGGIVNALHSQSFTIEDLVELSSMSIKNIDNFMNRNGYSPTGNSLDSNSVLISFKERFKAKRKDTLTKRTVDIYNEQKEKYFSFHTTSLSEFLDGQSRLIKNGFFYDEKKEISKDSSMLYQKRNITIEAISSTKNEFPRYTFLLHKKEFPKPDSILYAEDLLNFTSHEYLINFFGEQNVKKDMYYFSETELKRCSVLFGNSPRQAVFVWGDENNLNKLSYILISNVIPTVGAEKFNEVLGDNEWEMKNGIHSGMGVKELLKLNESDFEFYGNQSALAFMVKPGSSGKIDFSRSKILLSCSNCNRDKIFNKASISAMDVATESMPVYVYYFIIYPEKK
jgi:hypothetical protein